MGRKEGSCRDLRGLLPDAMTKCPSLGVIDSRGLWACRLEVWAYRSMALESCHLSEDLLSASLTRWGCHMMRKRKRDKVLIGLNNKKLE